MKISRVFVGNTRGVRKGLHKRGKGRKGERKRSRTERRQTKRHNSEGNIRTETKGEEKTQEKITHTSWLSLSPLPYANLHYMQQLTLKADSFCVHDCRYCRYCH